MQIFQLAWRSSSEFVTVGVRHICFWTFANGTLTCASQFCSRVERSVVANGAASFARAMGVSAGRRSTRSPSPSAATRLLAAGDALMFTLHCQHSIVANCSTETAACMCLLMELHASPPNCTRCARVPCVRGSPSCPTRVQFQGPVFSICSANVFGFVTGLPDMTPLADRRCVQAVRTGACVCWTKNSTSSRPSISMPVRASFACCVVRVCACVFVCVSVVCVTIASQRCARCTCKARNLSSAQTTPRYARLGVEVATTCAFRFTRCITIARIKRPTSSHRDTTTVCPFQFSVVELVFSCPHLQVC